MLLQRKLSALKVHKQALLLESQLNRLTLQNQLAQLQDKTVWIANFCRGARSGSLWPSMLTPLAGLALGLAARTSFWSKWMSTLTKGIEFIQPFIKLSPAPIDYPGHRRMDQAEKVDGTVVSTHQQDGGAL